MAEIKKVQDTVQFIAGSRMIEANPERAPRNPLDSWLIKSARSKRRKYVEYGIILGQAVSDVEIESFFKVAGPLRSLELLEGRFPESQRRPILILTAPENVANMVTLLISNRNLAMVGTAREHEWMAFLLRYVVATPQDVLGHTYGAYVGAVLVADMCERADEAISWLESFVAFSGIRTSDGRLQPSSISRSCPKRWLSPRLGLSLGFEQLLKQILPEAAACTGFGDHLFHHVVQYFAQGEFHIFTCDWSSIMAIMPGMMLLAGQVEPRVSSLIVAPSCRVASIVKLLQAFARYMCLSHLVVMEQGEQGGAAAHIVVGTPRGVSPSDLLAAKRLVVVEADKLLASGFKPEIISVLDTARNAVVMVQCGKACPEAKELMEAHTSRQIVYIKEAKVSMDRVKLFVVPVMDEEEKLQKVAELHRVMGPTNKLGVLLDNPCRVGEVALQLELLGLSTVAIHTAMNQETIERTKVIAENHGPASLVIGDTFEDNMLDLIVLDPPCDPAHYVKCCGVGRFGRGKLVFNVVTPGEEQLLQRQCENLGVSIQPLPSKLSRLRKMRR